MMPETYDHNDIDYLEGIEHIQTRPGMYVGMTENPNHLLYEVLDNSLDEAQGGHASLIAIQIDTKQKIATLADNGRGMPFKNDTIVKLANTLFSGGKFKKNESASYKIAAGLHGIGIVAVNALSESMHVTVFRDGMRAEIKFEKAKLISQDISPYTDKSPFATQFRFKPDKKYFESIKFDLNTIRERMRVASVHIPNLTLVLFVDGKKEIIKDDMPSYFHNVLLNTASDENVTELLSVTSKMKDESITATFCWEMNVPAAPRLHGCVNILSVNQGTHINKTSEVIRNVFVKLAKDVKNTKFKKEDCLIGIRCYTSIMLYEPEYSSQTKERLTVAKKDIEALYTRLEDKLYKLLSKKTTLTEMMFTYWTAFKNKKESKGTIVKSQGGGVTRFNQSIDSKLRDCTTHNVNDSELYVVEGTSAGGSIIQSRDPKIHAVLGLRGKIPNLADGKKEFLKNKEIIEIINALGTDCGDDFDIKGLRYSKIITACDADSDGCAKSNMLVFIKNNCGQIYKLSLLDIVSNVNKYSTWTIYALDEKINEFVWTDILKIWPVKKFNNWLDIELEDGNVLSLTHDHQVLTTNKGWIRADELTTCDNIKDLNYEYSESI